MVASIAGNDNRQAPALLPLPVLEEFTVSALRVTSKMREALEQLYKVDENSDFVAFSTALALERRHLVFMARNPSQVTSGGDFPRFRATLTQFGQQWCERYFPNTGREE